MDEDKGTVRIALNLRPDRPRQALILDWLYAACGRSGRFYGLTQKMEAAMFLYRAWSLGQVKIIPVPGITDDVLSMMADIGIPIGSPAGATTGTGTGFVTPTPATPASEPAAIPSVPEPAVSPPVSGIDLRTTVIPAEGGESTTVLDESSPLARLAKGIKW